MTSDPSAVSGILGLAIVFAIVAIAGLIVQWAAEKDEWQ